MILQGVEGFFDSIFCHLIYIFGIGMVSEFLAIS